MVTYNSYDEIPPVLRRFFKSSSEKKPVMVLDNKSGELVHKTIDKVIDGKTVIVKQYEMVDSYVERERTDLVSDIKLKSITSTNNHSNIYRALGRNAWVGQWMFFDKYISWLKLEPATDDAKVKQGWLSKRPYNNAKVPEDVQESYLNKMLSLRLTELKDLRNLATVRGFIYKGHVIISDRDAQNDLANIHSQYVSGIKEVGIQTYYKTDANKYLVLSGIDDVFNLLLTMSKFIEVDCFGTEARVSQELSVMSGLELLDVSLTRLFLVDHIKDRYVEPMTEEPPAEVDTSVEDTETKGSEESEV